MLNVCHILLLIVALRAVAPIFVSTTAVIKKYFYNPVDAVFELFSSIVKLLINFFTQALIKGVSDAIRWVVRNFILLVMASLFFYSILYFMGITQMSFVIVSMVVFMILWLMPNFRRLFQ
jgi:hypothetical protein